MLKLLRPLAFLDIESTGLNRENDRIVELGIWIIPAEIPVVRLVDPQKYAFRFNPGIPIPAEVTAIHGISDADVKDEPSFKDIAKEILELIIECDIAGFNSNSFDLPMLYNEFMRSGIAWDYIRHNFIDVGNIFKIKEPRTLSAAVKFYTGADHEDAHGALPDAIATADVFAAMLTKYEGTLPSTIEELALFSNYGKKMLDISGKFSYDDAGEVIFNFGPHRGKRAKDQTSFLEWMVYKASFPPDTVKIAMQFLNEPDDIF